MRKILMSVLLFMMFIPIVVSAETCDNDKVSISSISLLEKSDSAEELSEATISGRSINLNLSMSEVGDSIEYKATVKNDSNDDYELDKNSFIINSDYIDYTLESEDNSNIVKANSSKDIYLKVKYKTEVPDDAFISGTYNDNKAMVLNLSSVQIVNVPNTLKNPIIAYGLFILFIIIIICLATSYLYLNKKNHNKFMILLLGLLVIIPSSVYALCKTEIKIDLKVQIKEEFTGSVVRCTNMEVKNGEKLKREYYWGLHAWGTIIEKYKTKEECMSSDIPTVFDCIYHAEYDFGESIDSAVYIKHDIEKDVVKKSYVCFTLNSKDYCIAGGEDLNYEQAKQELIELYGESKCKITDEKINCSLYSGVWVIIYRNGSVSAKNGSCGDTSTITEDNISRCIKGQLYC